MHTLEDAGIYIYQVYTSYVFQKRIHIAPPLQTLVGMDRKWTESWNLHERTPSHEDCDPARRSGAKFLPYRHCLIDQITCEGSNRSSLLWIKDKQWVEIFGHPAKEFSINLLCKYNFKLCQSNVKKTCLL